MWRLIPSVDGSELSHSVISRFTLVFRTRRGAHSLAPRGDTPHQTWSFFILLECGCGMAMHILELPSHSKLAPDKWHAAELLHLDLHMEVGMPRDGKERR